jgi:hypothetical protein
MYPHKFNRGAKKDNSKLVKLYSTVFPCFSLNRETALNLNK